MEFREMRRKRQQLSDEESIGILEKATSGTINMHEHDEDTYEKY